MTDFYTFIISLAGGILPAIFWLWFWLREDSIHPEPKRLIVGSFFAGMVAVLIALPIETSVKKIIPDAFLVIVIWAICEEVLKFIGAWTSGLRKKENDEPIDPIIYLITAALGFAALENALFIFNPLVDGKIFESVITGNLRFLGASLLHVISSASIGIFMAFSFFKGKMRKSVSLMLGLLVATVLHTAFNWTIINSASSSILYIFSGVWFLIIILMILLEKIKKIRR